MKWSAGKQNQTHHILFDANSADRFSHVFTVTGDASWVIQAYGLPPGQCVCLEMVTGCKDGTEFEPAKASCGCCGLCLSNKRNIIPIPIEGRYRLVACTDDAIGDFKIIAYPTQIQQEFWSSLAMSCCNEARAPVTIASPNGTIQVTGADPNFTLDVTAVPTAGVLASSPVALNILCAALKASGCIPDAFDETVTNIALIPGGFVYTNEDGTPQTVMFPAPVIDINVQGMSLNTATNQLTITETDGSTHVVQLGGVSSQANNLLTLGPDSKPYLNCAAMAACGFVTSAGVVSVASIGPGVSVVNPNGPIVGLQLDLCAAVSAMPNLGPLQCA